jgi:ribosomal protein L22
MQKEKRVALEERKAAEKNAPEGRAYLKYVRISPRKVEIVLNLIRGKDTDTAMAILKNTPKRASEYLMKLLGTENPKCAFRDESIKAYDIRVKEMKAAKSDH